MLRVSYERLIGKYGYFSPLDSNQSSIDVCSDLSSALEKLAQAGYAPAYAPLSMCLYLLYAGEFGGDAFDEMQYWIQKAVEWLEKHTNSLPNDLLSYVDYSLFFTRGFGVEKDAKRAFYWMEKAAEQGDVTGQWCLSRIYGRGEGVEKDPERAFYWNEKAAKQGHAVAQFFLGYKYAKGSYVEKNLEQAAYWLEQAAEQGDSEYQWRLGEYYTGAGGVVEANREKAAYWLEKAAEQGDREYQWRLGERYADGAGIEANEARAVYWLEKGAEQGCRHNQLSLSERYADGNGVEENTERADYWRRQSINSLELENVAFSSLLLKLEDFLKSRQVD